MNKPIAGKGWENRQKAMRTPAENEEMHGGEKFTAFPSMEKKDVRGKLPGKPRF